MPYKPSLGQLATGAYRKHPRYYGCIGHWLMAEGGGLLAYDISGYGITGTLVNGPAWTSGQFGSALSFDGVDGSLDISQLTCGTTQTYTFWLNRINDNYVFDSNAGRIVISLGLNATAGNLSLYDGAWKSFGAVSTNVWHHVALGLNGAASTATAYLNGVQMGTPLSYTPTPIGPLTKIGSHNTNSNGSPYQGQLDDFRIYNRVLSLSEVQSLYTDPFLEFRAPQKQQYYFVAAATGPPAGSLALLGVGR